MKIKIIKDDFTAMSKIEQSAYAGSFKGTADEIKELSTIFRALTKKGDITALGAYEDELIGCVLHYNFTTNFHSEMIKTSGIGSLAVDLLHKKKKVAHHLITDSIKRAVEDDVMLYYLYPFNARFYRNFGFGYGAPMYTYCVAPKDFKNLGNRELLSYGDSSDYDEIIKFYNGYVNNTHGMSLKTSGDIKRLHRNKMGQLLIAKDDSGMIGYMFYTQAGLSEKNNQAQKLLVHEMVYNREALLSFASFFNAQKDQIDYIEVATHDRHFHHVLEDTCYVPEPRTQEIIALKVADKALGLMPLALDPQGLLNTINTTIKYELNFEITHPKASIKVATLGLGQAINIKLAINEFSSWVTGVINLETLYELGQLETESPEKLREVDQLLYLESPKSLTRF